MNSRFKFPRRVRIHGGECGAVARALHHEAQKVALTQNEQTLISDEKAFLSQADLGKSSGSTFIERKQMSTKTSIKRIALVAVSALGFGLLSTMPAKAASGDEGTYTVGGMTAATVTATPVVGTAVAVNFGINLTSNVAAAGAVVRRGTGSRRRQYYEHRCRDCRRHGTRGTSARDWAGDPRTYGISHHRRRA